MSRLGRLSGIALALAAVALTPASTARADSLRVGTPEISFGSLELDVPEGWAGEWEDSGGGYAYRPPGGGDFVLLVTPIPTFRGSSFRERCDLARQTAEHSQTKVKEVAVEKEIPILKTDGDGTCLRYVKVTDKTVLKPTSEDFKYGTQGAMAVGHLLVTFTILSNTRDTPEHEKAMRMLSSARHVGGPASDSSTGAAATRLAFPDRDWGMIVDFQGFELEPPQYRKEGTSLRFAAKVDEPWMMVTIFFEQAHLGDDPKAYREYYRESSFKAAPYERENIRKWERDGMVLLGYTNLFRGTRYPNVNAFWVRDGLWIDVHVSAIGDEQEAAKRFDRFLDAIRFTE